MSVSAGPDVEAHGHAILRALIAAAKADGRFDDAQEGDERDYLDKLAAALSRPRRYGLKTRQSITADRRRRVG